MKYENYDPQKIEKEILSFWQKNKVVEYLRERNKSGKKFYFLEGPPYTSGHIHIGHAWNMALKDIVLRYKRMQGFKVWDRMGYDMHGLPTEQKIMTKLNLNDKQDIEKYGVKKFTTECNKFCIEMMQKMNEDFKRVGSTLDFTEPYQPIKTKFMEAEWWLIKKAYEKKRLYQGLRTMHWDAATQTAVAKHELEYKQVTDTSIFVKLPLVGKKDNFLVVWTTTPWTIPLNLAVMVNPKMSYVEVNILKNKETWFIAKELLESVIQKAGIEKENYKIKKKYFGKDLSGWKYDHPLNIKEFLPDELQNNSKLFSILLSKEYVDASAGTGLVHCAPGCGPEDYEVGHKNGIPPFNCVNESGLFENFGQFSGWRAKLDDQKFITAIDEAGALLAKEKYIHDYPHGERSNQPVIFRTTKQWFFKVEDLKEKLLQANEKIYWNPEAGKNAFRSWLENLRDNSITKQRYWGTPVPIWQHIDKDGNENHIIVGSVEELENLSGQKVTEMHVPEINKITIEKNGKKYTRIPDVLDVWIDAGTVSWNCLNYPVKEDLFKELFPADFILEGKDQIRGWFNLLMIASFLGFDKPSFKNVYMHGFVTDISGTKMSKSLGNIISPYEVIDKYGADVLRYYMSQTNAGEDINFSWEECKVKERNLNILWNVHKLLINLAKENGVNPTKLNEKKLIKNLAIEENYILSKLNSTINKVTNLLEKYRLDEIIIPIEELFLELSRTYIQMVRDKSSIGTREEKEACIYSIYQVLIEGLKMFSIISPFISETIYLNLKDEFNLNQESISHFTWPKSNTKKINLKLEENFEIIKQIIQSSLAAREKAKLSLRWPIKELVVVTKNKQVSKAVKTLSNIIVMQINTKSVIIKDNLPNVKTTIKPDYRNIGRKYGKFSPKIIETLNENTNKVLASIEKSNKYEFKIGKDKIKIVSDMLSFSHKVPDGFSGSDFKQGSTYVNIERTTELEAEGYSREVTRNIQQARKQAGLKKTDQIKLFIQTSKNMVDNLKQFKSEIKDKVGAFEITISLNQVESKFKFNKEFKIKKESFSISFNLM